MAPTNGTARLASVLIVLGVGVSLVACGDDDAASDGAGSPPETTIVADAPAAGDPDAGTASDGASDGSATTAGPASEPGPAVTVAPGADPAETGFAPIVVDGEPLPEFTDDAEDPAVGMPAPALSGMNYDQEPSSFTPGDSPTLLVLLAHWCPHCNAEIPTMLEWQEAGGQPDGLDIIGVSTGVNPTYPHFPPGQWLTDTGWAWPVIADDAAYSGARAFGLAGFPFMVLVDGDGNVVARASGEQNPDQLNELVEQVAIT